LEKKVNDAPKEKGQVASVSHLEASVDGGAPVLLDLRLDERRDVVDVGDARVVRGGVGADARLARRDDELLARDSLRETCVVVSGIVNEPGTGTRRRDRSRPRVSGGSETRVDGAVARESTRADAKGDGGKRNDGRRDARGCHDSVNVSGRTSGDAPWRAGKLLACRRAATGGAARGLPA
jgi:hypothetical protein